MFVSDVIGSGQGSLVLLDKSTVRPLQNGAVMSFQFPLSPHRPWVQNNPKMAPPETLSWCTR